MVTSSSVSPLYLWHSQLLYLGYQGARPYQVFQGIHSDLLCRILFYPFVLLLVLLASTSACGSHFQWFIAV